MQRKKMLEETEKMMGNLDKLIKKKEISEVEVIQEAGDGSGPCSWPIASLARG